MILTWVFGGNLAPMVPGTILIPIGLFMAGWAAEEHVHWIVTDIVSQQFKPLHHIPGGANGMSGLHRESRSLEAELY